MNTEYATCAFARYKLYKASVCLQDGSKHAYLVSAPDSFYARLLAREELQLLDIRVSVDEIEAVRQS